MKALEQGRKTIASKSDLARLITIFLGFLSLYLLNCSHIGEVAGKYPPPKPGTPLIMQDHRTFVALKIGDELPNSIQKLSIENAKCLSC